MEVKEFKLIKENNDSLEIGTAKLGVIKVYGDFANKEGFKAKIDSAIDCRTYAQMRMDNLK